MALNHFTKFQDGLFKAHLNNATFSSQTHLRSSCPHAHAPMGSKQSYRQIMSIKYVKNATTSKPVKILLGNRASSGASIIHITPQSPSIMASSGDNMLLTTPIIHPDTSVSHHITPIHKAASSYLAHPHSHLPVMLPPHCSH